jgi:Met-zincin/Domain of unknown function (DUF5117)
MTLFLRAASTALAAAMLSACASITTTVNSDKGAAAAGTSPAGTATAVPAASAAGGNGTRPALAGALPAGAAPGASPAPRPFAEVIKDAKEKKGFLTLWQKDERTLLEIRTDQLDQPFFFAYSLAQGLGERFFWPGLSGHEQVVVLKRVGNNVQLIAKNLLVRAPAGTPLEVALKESYSDSLLASAPVASAVHPDRKSFLVDATTLLGGDLAGAQTRLEAAYRMPYSLDRSNTSIDRVRVTDEGTYVTVRQHFAVPKLPAPPVTPPASGTPRPSTPSALPDGRSLFLAYTYTLAPLPKEPMRPRLADQRVGHFTTAFWDFGTDLKGDARTHYVERWRLEKKDPTAEISEPKERILVWMDKNIPLQYREAVRSGILEWNKAFERAGFRNAIEVRQQPADAEWSTLEGTRHLAVRWFAQQGPGATAVGPSQSDPRTGEILRGAAIIPENWLRFANGFLRDQQPRLGAATMTGLEGFNAPAEPFVSLDELLEGRQCSYGLDALEQAAFGFELLTARGAFQPGSPDAQRFVAGALKDVVMHEVGHALGLRHNFRGSASIKPEQLRDAAFTAKRGVSNSVMDYNGLNIPLEQEKVADYNQTTLGSYDYWAIEYAYRELPADREVAELARIAGQSADNPNLAYATDEDVLSQVGGGIDPMVNQRDLSDDPLAFYRRSFALARELWTHTEKRELAAGDNFEIYRRNLQRGLNQFAGTVGPLSKYVGGVYTSRAVAGGKSAVALLTPVPAPRQREALSLLTRELFSADSFRFDPVFMTRLGVDHLDRVSNQQSTDFSLATSVLAMQRSALDQLMGDGVAARLADAETKVRDRRQLLTLAEVHARLADSVWSELKSGSEIESLRRNLQREHVRRVALGLVRPSTAVAADVRAVNRQVAVKLQADLQRALGNAKLSAITRAHLAESASLLADALKAPMVRSGV